MNFGLVKSFASIGVITAVAIVISVKLYYKYKYKNNKKVVVMESIDKESTYNQDLADTESVESTEPAELSDSDSYVTVNSDVDTKENLVKE